MNYRFINYQYQSVSHKFAMKSYLALCICLLIALSGHAEEDAEPLQATFNKRYADYFQAGSQAALPFARMDKQDWKKLFSAGDFQLMFSEPERFYGGKSYTLKLYRETGKNLYYLDAIGGFWGMEELVFGPIPEQELK